MRDLSGKLAVITGGGTGMGRALARQLVAEGCHVATCDLLEENLAETLALCRAEAAQGVRVTAHRCDVADEEQIDAFVAAVATEHDSDHIHLLFNNAGISGGGSFVNASRDEWERTFNICWNGVYLMTRAFLPMLLRSPEGHIVNTSSVNGFRATLGANFPHTAYSAAKFAVKGFTEALITDFRFNAPHLRASVVMPGHVGTGIAKNSGTILGTRGADDLSDDEVEAQRDVWFAQGRFADPNASVEVIREAMRRFVEDFEKGGLTPDQAARIILDGVKAGEWRILVGPDAVALDREVRAFPRETYDPDFMQKVVASMAED